MKRNDQNNNHENDFNTIMKLNGKNQTNKEIVEIITMKKRLHYFHKKKWSKPLDDGRRLPEPL